MMFEKILVAIDGSKNSYDALDTAMDLVKKYQAKLYLVSVVNTANMPMNVGVSYAPGLIHDLEDDAKTVLNKAKGIVKSAGLTCDAELLNGEPRDELLEFPKQNKIDLIVVGKTGTHALERFFLGSVTRYVSEHSKINVLIVS